MLMRNFQKQQQKEIVDNDKNEACILPIGVIAMHRLFKLWQL